MKSTRNGHAFATKHLRLDLGRRVVHGGTLTFAGQGVKLVLQIGSTILLARLLSPEAFGLMAMVVVLTGFAALFSDLGLSMATIQRETITHAQVSMLFWVNVAAGTVIATLVAALAPVIAWFYGEPRLEDITLVLASTFLLSGVAVQHKALLQRQMRFGMLVAVDVLPLLFGVATAVALSVSGAGYWALVANYVVVAVLTAVLSWTLSGWRPGLPSRASGSRSLLAIGGHLTGFNLINYGARNLDNILIGWWWGASALGLYDRAYRLFTLPLSQINQPITRVAVPALARLKDDPHRYRQAYLRMLGMLLLITLPGVVFVLAMADQLIPILLGAQWEDTVPIFSWLALAALLQPLTNTTGWLFITQERSREMLQWGVVGGALAMLSFVVGLPWGPTGVAACYAISGLAIRTPLVLWWVTRRGPIRGKDVMCIVVPFAAAGIVTGGSLIGLRQFSMSPPLLGIAAALALSYIVSFAVLAVFLQGRRILRDLADLLRGLRTPVTSQG